ncbi:MAG: class I SAM-dependent methyltransferase [Actinomycetota bacterium]|nr:class I SAM-dependent methyltransferase [Actinomycetota bacterium]
MTEPGLRFDGIAEDYDRSRPSYPDELVDRACSRAALRPGSKVVEVGCGTGKLTLALVARGLHVEAVDPGSNLVAFARSRLAGSPVRFHVARFEDVELPAGAFDAVFSATAFHWRSRRLVGEGEAPPAAGRAARAPDARRRVDAGAGRRRPRRLARGAARGRELARARRG